MEILLQNAFSSNTRLSSGIGHESIEIINQLSFSEGLIDPVAYATTKETMNYGFKRTK
jgi:hypothetical protein